MNHRFLYIIFILGVVIPLVRLLKEKNIKISDKPTPGLDAPENKVVKSIKYIILFAILAIHNLFHLFNFSK